MIALYLDHRYGQIEDYMKKPIDAQQKVFHELLSQGKLTEYGKNNRFQQIHSKDDYSRFVPITDYEDIRQHIHDMMNGKSSVLWPGKINWFAKSSGTTSDKSKFIPVSKDNLHECHIKASWDVVTLLYHSKPQSRIFSEKNLIMGGTVETYTPNPDVKFGDISGVMLDNMPIVGRPFYTPDFETALLADWNEKLERMVKTCSKENVVMFGGVPTWLIVLFNKILEYTGKSNILEVWPDLQAYVHGGVGFSPYREQFKKFIPSDDFSYMEVYNASEGYFGIQDDLENEGMLLLLDNGVYYEFIPMSVWGTDNMYAVPLEGVDTEQDYAIVVTTNSGLWRYQPGDTVRFTSTYPYRIKITGRTKHFINVFGEELMVSNTDKALANTAKKHQVQINDYTVAPIFMKGNNQGGHEWLIEFDTLPANILDFEKDLDNELKSLNSDYEAKRYNDIALVNLIIKVAPKGTFLKWMQINGKLGAQNKIPRLSNSRKYLEEMIKLC